MDEKTYARRQLKNFSLGMLGCMVYFHYLAKGEELKRQHRAEDQSRATSNARSHDERCDNAEGPWELCEEHRAAFRAWAYGEPERADKKAWQDAHRSIAIDEKL